MIRCSLFLARLKLFLLLVTDQAPDFLLRFLVDLLNFLFLLLWRQRAVGAHRLNLRTRVERELVNEGVDREGLPMAVDAVLRVLDRVSRDSRGRWLFDPAHRTMNRRFIGSRRAAGSPTCSAGTSASLTTSRLSVSASRRGAISRGGSRGP